MVPEHAEYQRVLTKCPKNEYIISILQRFIRTSRQADAVFLLRGVWINFLWIPWQAMTKMAMNPWCMHHFVGWTRPKDIEPVISMARRSAMCTEYEGFVSPCFTGTRFGERKSGASRSVESLGLHKSGCTQRPTIFSWTKIRRRK